MSYYSIYRYLSIVLLAVFFVFPKVCAGPIADSYLWLELGDGFFYDREDMNREINIYFGSFPDQRNGLKGPYNINAFYATGKKDNQGREIFYALEINSREAGGYVVSLPHSFSWRKVVVTASKRRDGREYNYCAMTSFFMPSKISQSFPPVDKPIPDADFAGAFDVSIYRERIREDPSINRKRLFPLRMQIKFNKAAFGNQAIKIIDMHGDGQELTTAGNGELVYFPKSVADNRQNSGNKRDADLVLMQGSIDDKIYICAYTITFSNAITKERNFNLQLGLFIFVVSFTASVFLLYRKAQGI